MTTTDGNNNEIKSLQFRSLDLFYTTLDRVWLVSTRPQLSLEYQYNGTLGTPTTDDTGGLFAAPYTSTKALIFSKSRQKVFGLEEQNIGTAGTVATTLISLFGKQTWTLEAEFDIRAFAGTSAADDVLFRWMGTRDGFTIDVATMSGKSYLSGKIPTQWIMKSIEIDLHEETVDAKFVQTPIYP
jgi:hypothetical protein